MIRSWTALPAGSPVRPRCVPLRAPNSCRWSVAEAPLGKDGSFSMSTLVSPDDMTAAETYNIFVVPADTPVPQGARLAHTGVIAPLPRRLANQALRHSSQWPDSPSFNERVPRSLFNDHCSCGRGGPAGAARIRLRSAHDAGRGSDGSLRWRDARAGKRAARGMAGCGAGGAAAAGGSDGGQRWWHSD
jgi:hypothetical protein